MYLVTVGAIAFALRSLLTDPPTLPWTLLALGAYLAIITFGVVFARFEMFADVLSRGPTGARGVALTFDDGPDPKTTPRVLDALDAAGAKATFFVIGRKAERHPELVRDIVARGHALGVHGYDHDRFLSLRLPWRVRRDLEQAITVLAQITGHRPQLYRAPVGHVSPAMARVVAGLDLTVVGWSIKSLDGWSGASPERVLRRVVPSLGDGAIVLLHDAAERGDFEPASLEALPEILEVAARRQLDLVRVDSWLTAPVDGDSGGST
jgi:peptidoglycan/xylan/chitin deacetylase (PgdA/CDA1 family)